MPNRHSHIAGSAVCAALATVLLFSGCSGGAPAESAPSEEALPTGLSLTIVSSRPELVSGGDVLLRSVPAVDAGSLRLLIDAFPASGSVRVEPDPDGGSLIYVSGLREGVNTITVLGNGSGGTIQVTNHPTWGPVVAGPLQLPFVCETNAAGLGDPLDANCSAATQVHYFYKSSSPNAFDLGPLPDPDAPYPDDLATTTTVDGKTVPFIVRVESGTINRGVYHVAVLDDPHARAAGAPYRPTEGWNRRLIYSFGGGCGVGHRQGGRTADGFARSEEARLAWVMADGYAQIVHSLTEFGVSCNDVTAAESVMMMKEHFIEAYAPPKWTVSRGGSGGGIQQLMISHNYPGLIDGLIPRSEFSDNSTTLLDVVDCRLMRRVFAADPASWNEAAQQAVTGFATSDTCSTWDTVFTPALNPKTGCDAAVPAEIRYDPDTQPDGVRCTLQDNWKNIFGTDSRGFAPSIYDNVGIEYGRSALLAGTITPAQFVSLNEDAGGVDIDFAFTPERIGADATTLRTAYRSGRVMSGERIGDIPIISVNYYVDATPMFDVHDRVRPFITRERIRRAYGDHDNHVIWTFGPPGLVYQPFVRPDADGRSLEVMRQWLDALADRPTRMRADIVASKPAAAIDGCVPDEGGQFIADPAEYGGSGPCDTAYPTHSTPRMIAGGALTHDVLKCQLRPFNLADYGVIANVFTPDQAARLAQTFASGVCDYALAGIEQASPVGSWLTYDLPYLARVEN